MKRLLILSLFLLTIIVFGRQACYANCDYVATSQPVTCDAMADKKMWCDNTSASNPIVKICINGTGWVQAEQNENDLNISVMGTATFSNTVTNDGAVTNNSTVTNNGAVTQAANFTVSAGKTLDFGANTLTMIGPAAVNGDAVRYEQAVLNSGDQTIAGTKTFSSSPVLSAECDTTGEACPFESVVRDIGDQTVAGIKTFSSFPVTPSSSPTTDYQVANKQYVDSFAFIQPDDIPGLMLWLKADSLALSDNDPVGTWADSSSNVYDLTQSTGSSKPTFKTNIIDGKPVVRFDGTDDYLSNSSAISNIITASAYTIFAVFKANDTSGVRGIILDPTANNWGLNVNPGPTNYVELRNNGTGGYSIASTTYSASTNTLVTGKHANSTLYIRKNNGSESSTASGGNTSSLTNGSEVGKYGSNYTNGDIAEIIIYNRALESGEEVLVRAYLHAKYPSLY